MARNVNEIEADEATQGGNIMERDTFLDVLSSYSKKKGEIAKKTGDCSAILNKAESDHNLDKKAISIVHWATRQEPSRLNAFLRHFDAYREYATLDNMAGEDMFAGKTKGGPKKAAAKTSNGSGEAKNAKAPKSPKGGGKKKAPKPEAERQTFGKAAREPGMALADAMGEAILSHETQTAGQG